MENKYIKQFPDLLRGKKLMYVHGFASSAQSGTVKRLREAFPNAVVIAEDIPLHPQEGLAMLQEMARREQPDLIVGTSMGGMYTEMLRGFDRIVVNPAFAMGETMTAHGLTGAQSFQNPRQDGVQDFIVTKALVKEYRLMTELCFREVTAEEQQRVFGLFGDEDDLVNTYDLFHAHYPNAIRFHGGHRMDDGSFMHSVLPVIRWIDDRQENRARPVVYIGLECMKDTFGKLLSSVQKAFRQLIEHYQVYIVAPSLATSPSLMSETVAWAEQFVNVPAWNHIVFTNRRDLLIGDFLIAETSTEGFFGTNIRFGSDEFKTWEDVITFFQRVNG